ncbi:MAG: serine/threonine-protein phosphatase [Caldilineaceae bacterium]|jgi:protein phosphatase|nr:serine/threonine-protein phosphatase [Caldilineaceae bacterium]
MAETIILGTIETGDITIASQQDQGRVRARQEDSCLVERILGQPVALLLVADGMGGQRGGDIASRAAVVAAVAEMRPWLSKLQPVPTLRLPEEDEAAGADASQPFDAVSALADSVDQSNGGELMPVLEQTVQVAHAAVRNAAAAIDALDDAGCTFILAVLVGRTLYLAHVGDSRAYLWRQAQLRQLTHDHSGAAALVAAGVLAADEARAHPAAHQLYRYLGGTTAAAKADLSEHRLEAGDTLLLCSDGLWDMLPDVEIARHLLAHGDLPDLAAVLIDAANRAGGEDNISVVLAHIGAVA